MASTFIEIAEVEEYIRDRLLAASTEDAEGLIMDPITSCDLITECIWCTNFFIMSAHTTARFVNSCFCIYCLQFFLAIRVTKAYSHTLRLCDCIFNLFLFCPSRNELLNSVYKKGFQSKGFGCLFILRAILNTFLLCTSFLQESIHNSFAISSLIQGNVEVSILINPSW